MTRRVFSHRLRFEKGRRRVFFVAVFKVVHGRSPARAPSLWGSELAEAWKSVGA